MIGTGEYERLHKIVSALDRFSIVSITDENGTITYVNKKFCEISKYSQKELIGQNHRIIKSGYHPPEFYQGLWKAISSGKIWYGEIKNKAKDGTFYWVKSIIMPIFQSGKIVEYISIRTDITQQKDLQEEILMTQRLSVIGKLSARLAHDLRNPLSIIKNTINIIKIGNPTWDKKSLEEVDRINRAVSRMSHQINDVLDYVKPKPLVLNNWKLREILNLTVELMSIPNTVKISLPKNDIAFICDGEKLEIVFANLITNAIQVMNEKGEINIRFRDKNDQVIIEVQDTGPGIPDDILPKIFDPLFTTQQVGTGLGLPSCKAIIEKHGGIIDVKTELGKGTRFIIKLPKNT